MVVISGTGSRNRMGTDVNFFGIRELIGESDFNSNKKSGDFFKERMFSMKIIRGILKKWKKRIEGAGGIEKRVYAACSFAYRL